MNIQFHLDSQAKSEQCPFLHVKRLKRYLVQDIEHHNILALVHGPGNLGERERAHLVLRLGRAVYIYIWYDRPTDRPDT